MKPLKAKDLIPQVAEKLELPVETVKEIVSYYWQEVRRNLSSLKHPRVHITNLGDFLVKEWKLDNKIKTMESFEEANKMKGLQLINARFKTAESLYDMKAVKKQIAEEKQRESFIKMHKKSVHGNTQEHNTDMEKQGSDPGGSDQ